MKPRIRTAILALLIGGAATLALPLLLLGGAVAYMAGGEYPGRTSFGASAWQNSARVFSADPVRIRMVDDLLERHSLGDMIRAEVVAILGEPDRTAYFREWGMVYRLGPERSLLSMDSEWLVLRLDENQQVVEFRVVRD